MGFKILVGVRFEEDPSSGLILPAIFMNKIPSNVHRLRLKNCKRNRFLVRFQILDDGSLLLTGNAWRRFVRDIDYPNIAKFCFIQKRAERFWVKCFNVDGLEYVDHPLRGGWLERCLVEASEHTYYQQKIPHSFLSQLNMRYRRAQNTTVRVDGPCEGGQVDVLYAYGGLRDLGVADGFHGKKWTTICVENEVQAGFVFMFTNKDNHQFTFDLFNSEGLGLDLNVFSSEEEDHIIPDYVSDDDEADEMLDNELNHKCSLHDHPHIYHVPQFYKKLEFYVVSRNVLTIPKEFVRDTNLQSFNDALIHFGNLMYEAKLEKKLDQRRVGDETHVVMKAEWGSIVQEAGFSMGKIIRFELNVEACVPGQTADFDVC